MLAAVDGSPTDEFQGINREHGADDPIGAKAVTAPATVSGSLAPSSATGKPGRPAPGGYPQVRRPAIGTVDL